MNKKIAYIILAHNDPKQLKRLIEALNYREENDFFIHIDQKSDIDLFKVLFEDIKNVYFVEKRAFIQWAAFSQILALKELLKCVVESENHYNRVVCLSGLDYPIFSNEKILSEFEADPKKEFIMGMNLTKCNTLAQRERFTVYHFFRSIKIRNRNIKRLFSGTSKIIMRKLPFRKEPQVKLGNTKCDIYMGSDWWGITYECARHVYHRLCTEHELLRYFKTAFAPREMCVQTIVFNSKYGKNAIHYDDVEYNGLSRLTPLHFIIYKDEIKVYNETHYDLLLNSGKMFFRKAKSGQSETLIKMIEKQRILED
ncbi:beta-1,6-N-acetylglucosaminyltransferase [Chitinispirillales bacterium ANBcel5]|uniref:beta-1,6-N-acetylglucosaminyltransferase n=1 Tax=Cellulosispirillum alkaliphilum TaxID=3039283 RepID=UPI002A51ECAB|nr:beta-1,6-N-acetylglucosaminyltransferase [Chitinispirillales bacterium ANBcel5]